MVFPMTRGQQFILFMQITTLSTYKTKPNLQVKAMNLSLVQSSLSITNLQ